MITWTERKLCLGLIASATGPEEERDGEHIRAMLSRSILVQRDSANCFSPLMKTALVPFHRPPPMDAGRSGLKYDTKVTIAHRRNHLPPFFSLSQDPRCPRGGSPTCNFRRADLPDRWWTRRRHRKMPCTEKLFARNKRIVRDFGGFWLCHYENIRSRIIAA